MVVHRLCTLGLLTWCRVAATLPGKLRGNCGPEVCAVGSRLGKTSVPRDANNNADAAPSRHPQGWTHLEAGYRAVRRHLRRPAPLRPWPGDLQVVHRVIGSRVGGWNGLAGSRRESAGVRIKRGLTLSALTAYRWSVEHSASASAACPQPCSTLVSTLFLA